MRTSKVIILFKNDQRQKLLDGSEKPEIADASHMPKSSPFTENR